MSGDLTPRELEVFHLVVEGKTNKEIAKLLGISPETVKMHMKHIFQKFDIRNRMELMRLAYSEGWWENG